MDSSFSTIIAAVEEGRGIFDNIRKVIIYLMSDAFEEIIAVVGTILLGLPLPVSAAQILWINLVSDGFPDLALTVDPKIKDIMKRPPRSPQEKLVNSWMKKLMLIVSVTGGLIALFTFVYFLKNSGLDIGRSITFAILGTNSLVYVFSVRTLRSPFWIENPFENKWLNLAFVGGMILQIMPFVSPTLRNFFGVTSLSVFHWTWVLTSSLIMFIIIEVSKHSFRVHLK